MAWILKMMLVFVLLDIERIYSVGPNAKLTATSTTQRGSLLLECTYVGDRKWSAVQWFNASIPYPLILQRNGLDEKLKVFAESTSPFDKDRVNSHCSLDICILEINLLPIDDNSSISCSFLDPYGSETKARFTLKVPSAPVSSAPVPTEDPGNQILIAVVIVVIVVAVITIFVYCKKYYNNRGTYRVVGNKDIPEVIIPMKFLETNSNEQQMPDQVQSDTFHDVKQAYGVSQINN